ncbi:MAG TPA: two-component regulator propeller domain-containing protein [Blastocatellia bacterium]|nr:two-component regulator propeller domain-containing protein [Blastocatellia bacterium]
MLVKLMCLISGPLLWAVLSGVILCAPGPGGEALDGVERAGQSHGRPGESRGGNTAARQPRRLAEAGRAGSPYHFDVWTTDNGLPQNSVSSILQAHDGFLWLTTNDGLVRYDGVQFRVFDAGNHKDLKSSRFSRLFEDRAGNLWILTEDAKLISYQGGLFTTYTTADGLPDNRVWGIRNDEDGTLLVETPQGFAWWRAGRFVSQDPAPNRPYTGVGYPVQSGAVWFLDRAGLHRVEGGRVMAEAPVGGLTRRDVKSLYEDREGALWVGLPDGVLMRFKDGRFTYYGKKDGLPGSRINCIFEDRRGNLWLGMSDAGLFRFKNGQFTGYTAAEGLTGNSVVALYEDREGVLWIGTTSGLNRLRDDIIITYSTENGLAANNVYPICEDGEGTIWIGSWAGLTRYKDGAFVRCDEQYGVANQLVTALMADRQGGLWIGTLGAGVKRFKDGKVLSLTTREGLPGNVVRAICQDRQGSIWFGTQDGLVRYSDGALSVYTTAEGLPANAVNVMIEDRQGSLWVGTQAGLCRYADGRFDTYPQEESLVGYMVRALYEDRDGALWVGMYDRGLTRLKDGRFTNYSVKDGLFSKGVFQILEDARANFWISCNLGIYRVSKQELNDVAEGRATAITAIPYGKRDGMTNSECNGGSQPAGIKARDGKLWFPTQGGVAVVDPEAVPVSDQPPPVVIEDVLLDNQPVAWRGAVEISPGIENFEIHYTALSFIMPERLRFKYKLEGLDADWVEAGTRRVAYYSHVRPGGYTFKVIAANRDGVWNLDGAAVKLRIRPPFWRTWWFFSLATAVIAGGALLGYRRRINRLEKARRAQQAFSQQLIRSQESERQRIAAELHDSLGQHLLIIKNTALLGLRSESAKEQFDDISATASQAIDEVREISYNLRPYQLDDLGLTRAIEAIVEKVSSSSEISFSSKLARIDGRFSPEAEINIYRIVQESLNNIVKHSAAKHARVIIESQGPQVSLTIQDDGRGFEPEKAMAVARQGGFGLKGISERARMLGAKYAIYSAAGQGTTITLNLGGGDGQGED